jgi:hypothetical protein
VVLFRRFGKQRFIHMAVTGAVHLIKACGLSPSQAVKEFGVRIAIKTSACSMRPV